MKYPRTKHLPNSPGFTQDDERLMDISHLVGKEVIYTEKLDGECTNCLTNKIHARSEDSNFHPSQSWMKSFHSSFAWKIPQNIQIVGENVYAKHSIFYDNLTTFFYVFAVIDLDRKVFKSVDETIQTCKELGLQYVPILWRGTFHTDFQIPKKSSFGDTIEGFVVRVVNEFSIEDSGKSMAKWVRAGHVQTDEHWTKSWKKQNIINR
jgi:hypothetical protein